MNSAWPLLLQVERYRWFLLCAFRKQVQSEWHCFELPIHPIPRQKLVFIHRAYPVNTLNQLTIS